MVMMVLMVMEEEAEEEDTVVMPPVTAMEALAEEEAEEAAQAPAAMLAQEQEALLQSGVIGAESQLLIQPFKQATEATEDTGVVVVQEELEAHQVMPVLMVVVESRMTAAAEDSEDQEATEETEAMAVAVAEDLPLE